MKISNALATLAALAQESRLRVFRLLVQRGPEGFPAGEISTQLGIPAPTLSFHLHQLAHADLVRSKRNGRSVCYAANFERMNRLIDFLLENCCGGDSSLCTSRRP